MTHMIRSIRSLKPRLFNGLAALTVLAAALNASAGAAFAQVPPPPSPPTITFPGATFVVTTNADTNDGVCDAHCSLREAITAANAVPNILQNTDHIVFAIPVTQSLTIQLQSELPALTGPVSIDGNNQSTTVDVVIDGRVVHFTIPHPGIVELHGGATAADGLTLNTAATLTNLNMTGFSGTALELGGAGTKTLDSLNVHDNTGTGVAVLGNNATLRNSTITANGVGVRLGSNNTVSGNTITGNATGVSISGATVRWEERLSRRAM
jgi:CSLREA domain-containing protein